MTRDEWRKRQLWAGIYSACTLIFFALFFLVCILWLGPCLRGVR